jgi:HPt (histidine-containing phosphotransfer) domain-containing protein
MEKPDLPVLAWEDALDRMGGDSQYLTDLMGCILVDLEGHLRDLQDAVDGGDRGLLETVAKIIEEKASAISAEALAQAARAAAESGDRSAAAKVEAEAARFRTQVMALRSPSSLGSPLPTG